MEAKEAKLKEAERQRAEPYRGTEWYKAVMEDGKLPKAIQDLYGKFTDEKAAQGLYPSLRKQVGQWRRACPNLAARFKIDDDAVGERDPIVIAVIDRVFWTVVRNADKYLQNRGAVVPPKTIGSFGGKTKVVKTKGRGSDDGWACFWLSLAKEIRRTVLKLLGERVRGSFKQIIARLHELEQYDLKASPNQVERNEGLARLKMDIQELHQRGLLNDKDLRILKQLEQCPIPSKEEIAAQLGVSAAYVNERMVWIRIQLRQLGHGEEEE